VLIVCLFSCRDDVSSIRFPDPAMTTRLLQFDERDDV
jgi:hypothetical protein